MKKFRVVRQLISSIVCVVLAYIITRISLKDTPNDHIFMWISTTVMASGMLYCIFGLGYLLLQLITKEGFFKNNNAASYALDTLLYVGVCVGAYFLVGYICKLNIWIGIILLIFGVRQVFSDIRYLYRLAKERLDSASSVPIEADTITE